MSAARSCAPAIDAPHPSGILARLAPQSSSALFCRTGPRRSSPIRMRSRTSWAPTALILCCRPRRACHRRAGASCCRAACPPRRWTSESGANLDTAPSTHSMTTPACRVGLAEMMNYVGVVGGDKEVIAKIVAAQAHHKIDGHAPGLSGRIWLPISRRASIPTTSAPIWTMPWLCATASSS